MTKPPTNAGTDVGTVCEQCEHDWAEHVFQGRDPKDGLVACESEGCTCSQRWALLPRKVEPTHT